MPDDLLSKIAIRSSVSEWLGFLGEGPFVKLCKDSFSNWQSSADRAVLTLKGSDIGESCQQAGFE